MSKQNERGKQVIIITKKFLTIFSKTAYLITMKFSGIIEGCPMDVKFVSDFENNFPFAS
jgi:hypothetical protein